MGADKFAPPPDMDADKPPPPYQPSTDDPGFQAAQSLLARGVKVALVLDSGNEATGSGVREYGVLTCVIADLKFAAKKPKVRFSTTYLSNIRDVELEQLTNAGQSELSCRISLQEGTAGSSYRFACTDAAGELSSSEVTTFVALVLKDKLRSLEEDRPRRAVARESPHVDAYVSVPGVFAPPPQRANRVNVASTFEELLEPLGLDEQYCKAFEEADLLFQDLTVVTREDLAEMVGITKRSDQIKIMAQIKRRFPDHPPCCCGGKSGPSAGTSARARSLMATGGEILMSNVVGALVG